MRVYARAFLLAASLAATPLEAQSLYLPTAPQGSGGEDSIETASGTRCRQSMNNNGAYLDLGLTGHASNGNPGSGNWYPGIRTDGGSEGTAYARVTVPLGRKPQQLDCSRLYELEIARMRREIELLELAAQ